MDSYDDPLPGITYVSPSLDAFNQPGRKMRIASKVIEPPEAYAFGTVKGELVIRRTAGASINIKAKFFEDDRQLTVLTVQGYSVATDKPHNTSFSFIGDEIETLLEFIANVRTVSLRGRHSVKISDEELRKLVLSRHQAFSLITENEDLFAEVIKSALTKSDVVAVAYRKQQLEIFHRLIKDTDYFAHVQKTKDCTSEGVWQRFFQKNTWIFGYGLNYIYLDQLDGKKLEQVVQGFRINQSGKRVDALMKTKGAISSLCFVEVKTHETKLLGREYREACWAPSADLAGALSQVQGTVAAAMDSIRSVLRMEDNEGNPTGEEIFNHAPKSYLVVGNLAEFIADAGVNNNKLRSFELFRRNLIAPEVITFDELYQRAQFIVQQSAPPAQQ
jgi:hypothetical protein